MQKIILGIDPGYDRIGWAIAFMNGSHYEKVNLDCIYTQRFTSIFDRYMEIYESLIEIIKTYHPTECAIESLFFFKNKKTALKVSEARGVILATLLSRNIPIFEYTPLQIKQTVTGFGRADKKAIAKMVTMEFKQLNTNIIDDAIDALAIIMTHNIMNKNKKFYV